MAGNGFGERIHNFFGQEGLPQGQHQSQVVDGSWASFSNGLLVGSHRQIDPSLVSNLNNYAAQQSVEPQRGESSNGQHGLNFTQQQIRSEFSRSQLQNQQQATNGYMHGNQGLQTMQNEANFVGMNAETGGLCLTSKGVHPDIIHRIPMRSEMGESPINYEFLGSQFPGRLQSMPRQQMPFNEMQLLQQKVMIKQMHEHRIRQQLQNQQLEARHFNSFNQAAFNGSRLSVNHSHPLINGVPLHDVSNNPRQPEFMTLNTNWMQQGISPAIQGSSGGLMFPPEKAHMNQFEQSLYGVPVSGARGLRNELSTIPMNKLTGEHVSGSSNSSLGNQQTAFSNHGGNIPDFNMLPRPSYQEKLFAHTWLEGSNNSLNFENLQNTSVGEKLVENQEAADPSEEVWMSQKAATLDPTEEKFLFGSGDNVWDAFGDSMSMNVVGNNMVSGSDHFGAFSSLQSGRWSALMQSAVAETSSGDTRPQERGSRQPSAWVNNNTGTRIDSRSSTNSNSSSISAHSSGFRASNAHSERVQSDTTLSTVKYFQDKGSKFLDHSQLEKSMAECSEVTGNVSLPSTSVIHVQNNSCSTGEEQGIGNRAGIWKAASNSNVVGVVEHKDFLTHNLKIQRGGFGIESSTVGNAQRNIYRHLDTNSVDKAAPQLNSRETYQIPETNEIGNSAIENSGDRSNLSLQTSTGGFRENAEVNAHDTSMLPGGKHVQSGPSIPRRFQYHPMGDIDVCDEPGRERVTQMPPTVEIPGNRGYFGQSTPHGQAGVNRAMKKGYVSQGDLNGTNEGSHKGMHQDCSPTTSGSLDRTGDRCHQVKSASSRQTMLELLHKVDQSHEHSVGTSLSGLPEAQLAAVTGSLLQRNQSAASQGFSLQLAPPSQPAVSPDNVSFSQSSLQAVNSSDSLDNASENGGLSRSRLDSWASNQYLPHQETYKGTFPGFSGQTNSASGFPLSRAYHQYQRTSAPNQSLPSEMPASHVNERDEYDVTTQHRQSAQIPSYLNPTTHNRQRDSAEGFPIMEAMSTSQPLVASSSSEQGFSSKLLSASRAKVSEVQHQLWSHLPNSNLESRFSRQERANQTSQNGGDGLSSGRTSMNVLESQGKDIAAKHACDVDSVFSKTETSQSTLQPLGQSIILHNISKEKNSVPREHIAGNGEDDSINGDLMKKIEDGIIDPQKSTPRGEQQTPLKSDGLVKDGPLNHKELVHPSDHTISHSFSNESLVVSAGADCVQISPQMAPSWFNQYGTFKNGLARPLNDSCRSTPSKIWEQSSSISGGSYDGLHSGQVSEQLNAVDPGQLVNMRGRADAEALSSESLPQDVTEQHLSVYRPKKRKRASSQLMSWSKEVVDGFEELQTLSEMEADWASSTNRLAEKMGVVSELVEDVTAAVRSKRRVICATQLIQQLLRPPPVRVMCLVASSDYETVVYTAARGAVGDACSTCCGWRRETEGDPRDADMMGGEREAEEYKEEGVEGLRWRTRSAERECGRVVDAATCITDWRVELEELEKLSVINRFARFHGRGGGVDAAHNYNSSSSSSSSSMIKRGYHPPPPLRYVTVAPVPRTLPDTQHCLSL